MIISSSLSTFNLIGLAVFLASKAEIAAKIKDWVSFPPNPPPILLTLTFIELNFCFKIENNISLNGSIYISEFLKINSNLKFLEINSK